MVKTMRHLLFFTAIATAFADNADCAVDGVKAMDQFSDAAIFIWAATKRCGKETESQVKCEVDITSAMQSVNDMINVIVSAVGECGAIKTDHQACGMAVSELTSAAAGLAAASGGIADACPKTLNNIPDGTATGLATASDLGLCIVDGKSALGSLFSASKLLSEVHGDCKAETREEWKGKTNSCAYKALDIVSALADMGAFVAASVNDCTSLKGGGDSTADCTSNVLATISSLHAVAEAGMHIDKQCRVDNSRLFLEDQKVPATGTSFLTYALAACLPIAAVLSFAMGRRARTNYEPAPARDFEAAF
jgi:hypothetical protein